jgi:hypothetical protein
MTTATWWKARRTMSLDVARLRGDLSAFAAVAGHPLTALQARALTLDTRLTVLVSARQCGKSYSLTALALWWAFRQENPHLAPVEPFGQYCPNTCPSLDNAPRSAVQGFSR